MAQVPSGGGIIVNEINQGGSGVKEYMEFLVIGDPDDPCADVDLSGWVIDDNNGSFESCGTGVGIQSGHYRFTSCYDAVPPGSLMVVYNENDPYTGMPADDETDADADGVYIIPGNSSCLEANNVNPSASPLNCNYSGPYGSPTANWAIGMSNSGDVAQTRQPDYTFFHGFSFGNVNTVYPPWPGGAGGGNSFNKGSGNLALDCGSFWEAASYSTTTAGSGTPGAANTANNANFIGRLKNCSLNYDDLNDAYNCSLLLPIYTSSVFIHADKENIYLQWYDYAIPENITADIQHSTDGSAFTTIEHIPAATYSTAFPDHVYTDRDPQNGWNYYRVVWQDEEETRTSNIVSYTFQHAPVFVFPNPFSDAIQVRSDVSDPVLSWRIISFTGKIVAEGEPENGLSFTLATSELASGAYYIALLRTHSTLVVPVSK